MLLESVGPLGAAVIALLRVVTILAVTLIATEDSTTTIAIVVITIAIVVVAADLVLVISMEITKIIKPGTSSRMGQVSRMTRALSNPKCSDGSLPVKDENLSSKCHANSLPESLS